jgi:hypothetical protein
MSIIIYQLFLVYGSLERLEFFWPYLTDKNPRYGIYNKTPLHFLATHGLTDVVEFMLDHLEDPNPADSFSITPLHNASRYATTYYSILSGTSFKPMFLIEVSNRSTK